MSHLNPKTLNGRSIAPRHFGEIGLPPARLHDWIEMTGFGPDTRGSQKWRLLSAADVLRLATIRALKLRTGTAISELGGLIDYIGGRDFLVAAVKLWRDGLEPVLVTDLAGYHEVQPRAEINLGWLVGRGGPLIVALSLDGSVRLMLAAMVRGGSDPQRKAALEVVARQSERAGDVDVALRFLLAGLAAELGTDKKVRRVVQVPTGVRAMDVRTDEEKRKGGGDVR